MPENYKTFTATSTHQAKAHISRPTLGQTARDAKEAEQAERTEASRLFDEKQQAEALTAEKAERQAKADALALEEWKKVCAAWDIRRKNELAYLRDRWQEQLKRHAPLPPDILPFEKIAELQSLKAKLQAIPATEVSEEVYEEFAATVTESARASLDALASLRKQIAKLQRDASSLFQRLFKRSAAKIFRTCSVSHSAPQVSERGQDSIRSVNRLLREKWHPDLSQSQQAAFSVHSSPSGSVIQIGTGEHGAAYLAFDGQLDPLKLAQRIVSKLFSALPGFFAKDSVMTMYNGELDTLNPKHVLPDTRIVRTRGDDLPAVQKRLTHILGMTAPKPWDTAVHIGIPQNREQMIVFHPRRADGTLAEADTFGTSDTDAQNWEVWQPVAPKWFDKATKNGFDGPNEGSSDAILHSLSTKANVIIVVAHSDGKRILLPSPPPEGSVIRVEDLHAHREAISANAPVVYLFCCEAALIADTAALSDEFLKCGASAVVAPQSKIGAMASAELFDKLTAGENDSEKMLMKLQQAETETGYREMEVLIG